MTKSNLPSFDKIMNILEDNRLWDAVGQEILTQTQEGFVKQQDPEGRKWKSLSERTILNRRNKNKSSIKILQDTGQLKNSIDFDYSYHGDKVIMEVSPGVYYGKYHQSTNPRRKIPRRAFLGISKENLQDIKKIIYNFVRNRLR